MRTLLVDDHADLTRALLDALCDGGFVVDVARTLEDASVAFSCASYAILLLELVLPDGDGLHWLRQLRSDGHLIPAVVMSGHNERDVRIKVLNAGADCFVPKPFSIDELLAGMRAILRRSTQKTSPLLTFGNLKFDSIGREVFVEEQPVRIAHRELCILEHLLNRPGRTVSRAQLENSLYAFDDEVSANALEVGIYRLRGLLSRSGATLRIKTARGIGYILEMVDDSSE
ncbi:response regulator [Rhizobium grahamii]|uniref:DNA-binding response regulator n=1 Tax=Rhizobium grahamii TaxID=1120045 RepID=A0A370KHC4_9HYPH|nr:response regulator transcription factor [Rhizobium grahamii]RDJ04507.1 DNA-binding response regulator [Rhizobium grahamii]